MRHEVKRYVYICDGLSKCNKGCPGTTVVDAINEKEADNIASMRGWIFFNATGRWMCTQYPHLKVKVAS